MTREKLLERLQQLQFQKEQAVFHVYTIDGAIQEVMNWVEQLGDEQKVEGEKNV